VVLPFLWVITYGHHHLVPFEDCRRWNSGQSPDSTALLLCPYQFVSVEYGPEIKVRTTDRPLLQVAKDLGKGLAAAMCLPALQRGSGCSQSRPRGLAKEMYFISFQGRESLGEEGPVKEHGDDISSGLSPQAQRTERGRPEVAQGRSGGNVE
jgi:hypothetical protein